MTYRSESIVRRVEKLREYFRDLRAYEIASLDELRADKTRRYAVERLLFLISENIIDVLDHVLSSRHDVVSDSYEEVIRRAGEHSLVTDGLALDLRGIGSSRNVLAHEYLLIRDDDVFANLQKLKRLLPADLIRRIVELRAEENRRKSKRRR